jgi:predicted dehydrogenase
MLGYGFMARAHSHALRNIRSVYDGSVPLPRLIRIVGRTPQNVTAAAERLGFEESSTDWRDLVADSSIDLFDNTGPNSLHFEPTIAAAKAGKHVICEKPLGLNADEAHQMWQAVEEAGVIHMCAFNYRFVPALALAREMITAGELGEIVRFRASYLQDWLVDASVAGLWRLDGAVAGSGALGDLGAHAIDLARYLVGEIAQVTGAVSTFTTERGGTAVTVDDAFAATVKFEQGALGTLEASRCCPGRKNALTIEINGTRGSMAFDLERLNELQHCHGTGGFRTILVTEPDHPHIREWWPPGHVIGWEHTFVHEFRHLLAAIKGEEVVAPRGATFEDGYRAAAVCDAILSSAQHGEAVQLRYRPVETGTIAGVPR